MLADKSVNKLIISIEEVALSLLTLLLQLSPIQTPSFLNFIIDLINFDVFNIKINDIAIVFF